MRWISRLLLLPLALALSGQAAEALHLQVAVNAAVPSHGMSRQSVKDVYLLKRQYWANRQAVVLVLQDGDETLHAAFCAQVLESPCDALEQAELERRYRGVLFAVVVHAKSAEDAASLVQAVPGAIAYFRAGTAPAGARVVFEP